LSKEHAPPVRHCVRFDSRKGILLRKLGLNSELCLLLHLPLPGFKRFIKREI